MIAGLLGLVLGGCARVDYRDHEDFLNDGEGRFTHSGAYVQVGYTKGIEDFSLDGVSTPGIASVDDAEGAILSFGYRGSRYLALEASVQELEGFDNSASGTGVHGFDARWLGVNAKVYPLGFLDGEWGRVQPYVVGGVGALWFSADADADQGPFGSGASGTTDTENSGAWRFGGGLDVYIVEHVLFFGEYAWVKPSASRLDDFEFQEASFGFGCRF